MDDMDNFTAFTALATLSAEPFIFAAAMIAGGLATGWPADQPLAEGTENTSSSFGSRITVKAPSRETKALRFMANSFQ
jgi:hypothetical protein